MFRELTQLTPLSKLSEGKRPGHFRQTQQALTSPMIHTELLSVGASSICTEGSEEDSIWRRETVPSCCWPCAGRSPTVLCQYERRQPSIGKTPLSSKHLSRACSSPPPGRWAHLCKCFISTGFYSSKDGCHRLQQPHLPLCMLTCLCLKSLRTFSFFVMRL